MSPKNRNVLVTCGGRWVGMILQLKAAMRQVCAPDGGKLVVASSDPLTPAGCFADAAVVVPLIRSPEYIDRLLDVCREHGIGALVPLVDIDVQRLAPHIQRFAAIGTTVICPPPDLADLCFDKLRFARFAIDNNLSHPRTYLPADIASMKFPAFAKRRRGFGSIGAGVCDSLAQAHKMIVADPELIFQELIAAPEATVDSYISRNGQCTVCVPRVRDKVIAGEAHRTHTIRHAAAHDLAMRTIAALARSGLRGPLNVQMFVTEAPTLIEVNTRLGSASILSNVATGGRLFASVLQEAFGEVAVGDPNDYEVGLELYRYFGDVFHRGSETVAIYPEPKSHD